MKFLPFRRSKSFLQKLLIWGRFTRLVKPTFSKRPVSLSIISRRFSNRLTRCPPNTSSMARRSPTGPPPTTRHLSFHRKTSQQKQRSNASLRNQVCNKDVQERCENWGFRSCLSLRDHPCGAKQVLVGAGGPV